MSTRMFFCWGHKVNGDPCWRRARGYCWQHQDQERRQPVASGRIVKQNGQVVSGLPAVDHQGK